MLMRVFLCAMVIAPSLGLRLAVDFEATSFYRTSPHIPKIIMQTGKSIDQSQKEAWLQKNPDFNYVFLSDADAISFLKGVGEEHVKNFHFIKQGAIKADYLRLVWLYEKGGVYIDIDKKVGVLQDEGGEEDIILVNSKADLETHCTTEIHNAFMAAPPKSPLIKKMIEQSVQNIANREMPPDSWGEQRCYNIAGPTLIASVLKKAVPDHCMSQKTCGTRFDSQGCFFPATKLYTTSDGEKVRMLNEGEDLVTQNAYDSGSPYGSGCLSKELYNIDLSTSISSHKIPNIVWVTGEWDSDSETLSEIKGDLEPNLVRFQGNAKSLAIAKFGKWTPLGSQIRYFSDENMDESVRNISAMLDAKGIRGVDKAYFNLRPGAYRADLWRLMVLWAEGGVYLDANIKLESKLEEWIDYSNDELVLVKDDPKGFGVETYQNLLVENGGVEPTAYWNAMMAAAPRNGYLENAIKDIVSNIHGHHYGTNPLSITGPLALGTSFTSQSNFPKNVRVELQLKEGHVQDKNNKMIATKNENLHHEFDPTMHYDPMWRNHQVYCDEKGPEVDKGKCVAK